MSEETEDQRLELPLCLTQTEDDDSSETSEDEDDQIKSLYSKLPEDLGFTLVGMNFGQSDFKTLKKLKMDLDTFLTLSEQELTDLGLKESAKLQESISKLTTVESRVVHKTLFWKPRVKDLRISSEDALLLLSNTFAQIQELRQFLEELRFTMSTTPPVNYMLSKNYSYRDVFRNAMTRALILSKCVVLEINDLLKKFEAEAEKRRNKLMETRKMELYGIPRKKVTADAEKKEEENNVTADAKKQSDNKGVTSDSMEEKEDGLTEVRTEINVAGKVQSSNSSCYFCKCAIALSTSGAFMLALWTLRKLVSSQKKSPNF